MFFTDLCFFHTHKRFHFICFEKKILAIKSLVKRIYNLAIRRLRVEGARGINPIPTVLQKLSPKATDQATVYSPNISLTHIQTPLGSDQLVESSADGFDPPEVDPFPVLYRSLRECQFPVTFTRTIFLHWLDLSSVMTLRTIGFVSVIDSYCQSAGPPFSEKYKGTVLMINKKKHTKSVFGGKLKIL